MHAHPRQAMARPLTTLVALLAAGSLAGVFWAGPVAAHAIVTSTEPRIDQVVAQSPRAVQMVFSEPVEVAFGAIRVFNGLGERVDEGPADHPPGKADTVRVALQPDLSKGTYTVSWRVISADGHPIAEAFVFHIQEPGENPRGIVTSILLGQGGTGRLEGIAFGVVRWVNFIGLLVLAGTALFVFAVWRYARAGGTHHDTEIRFRRRSQRLARAGWWAVAWATVAAYFLQISVAADLPVWRTFSPNLLSELAATRFGAVSLAKLGLLTLVAMVWAAARRQYEQGSGSIEITPDAVPVRTWYVVGGGALLLALMATPGLAGHAGTTSPVAVNLVADVIHVTAAAAWVGGLSVLLAAAFPAVSPLSEREGVKVLAPVVGRFSELAFVAVMALVLTGLFRSWLEVRALRALTDATYGLVLLAKLAVIIPILALGGINRYWTKPSIDRAVHDPDSAKAPLSSLRRLVGLEAALALVVLAITAFLVNLPPARTEAGIDGPYITDVRLGSDNLNVLVDPNQIGANEVHLTLTSPEGLPVELEGMEVLFRMPSEDIGPLIGEGTELATGHYVVQGRQLSVAGEWEMEVIARTGRFDEERVLVGVTVNP